MPESRWTDPYGAFNFKISAGGQLFGHFTECSGISIDVATVEYREGGQAAVVHQVPTITTYHDITLRYGLTESTQLWTWFLATAQGRVDRRNVSIVLLDAAGSTPVLQWDLIGAFPKRWVGPELRASARAVAVEEIVLAYDSLGRAE
ncbi:MAG: phage tail protein [Propionibacteriaceae bacterium]